MIYLGMTTSDLTTCKYANSRDMHLQSQPSGPPTQTCTLCMIVANLLQVIATTITHMYKYKVLHVSLFRTINRLKHRHVPFSNDVCAIPHFSKTSCKPLSFDWFGSIHAG